MDECSEPKVKSLAKSLKILSCFTIQEPVLGVTELAERIGVTKSNIHNILSTFTSMGYLDRLPDRALHPGSEDPGVRLHHQPEPGLPQRGV